MPRCDPQVRPGSWQELIAHLPFSREALMAGDVVLDTRRRHKVLPHGATKVGFIASCEQEWHLVFDISELDEAVPDWRAAIERPSHYRADTRQALTHYLSASLGDDDPVAEIIWVALSPVAGEPIATEEPSPQPDLATIPDPVRIQVSQRVTHRTTVAAAELDHEAPGWRQALADGAFQGDGIEDPTLVQAIQSVLDRHLGPAELHAFNDFEITSLTC